MESMAEMLFIVHVNYDHRPITFMHYTISVTTKNITALTYVVKLSILSAYIFHTAPRFSKRIIQLILQLLAFNDPNIYC